MKRLLLIVALMLCATGCEVAIQYDGTPSQPTHHVCDVPVALRQANWVSRTGSGSCAHATMVTALRRQDRPKSADWWRQTHAGGATPESMMRDLDAAGFRYVVTVNQNDVSFLEWAIRTHRGCGVTIMGGRHMVFLCDLTPTQAGLIDNNHPEQIQWVEREAFLTEWRNSYSWAIVPVYSPLPERPN